MDEMASETEPSEHEQIELEHDSHSPEDVEPATHDVVTSELDPLKEEKFQKFIYGQVVEVEEGTIVDDYPAISAGVSRTVPTQILATLLHRAFCGHGYNVLSTVPQKVMRNAMFMVDLRKLTKETDIYYDGLGMWDQNCGKITNYFRFVGGEAKQISDGKEERQEDVVAFVRRTDRNLNCKAYNRVVVTCKKYGLAVIHYFFKGRDEEPFEIVTMSQKGARSHNGHSDTSSSNAATPSRTGTKRKYSGSTSTKLGTPEPATMDQIMYLANGPDQSQAVPVRVTTVQSIQSVGPLHNPSSFGPSLPVDNENGDSSPTALTTYLKSHIAQIRQDRAEERQLRREELEQRKRERAEDREWQREEAETRRRERIEEIELRKQELALEKTKINLEQQRWELDRKEKELFLDLLRKKLLDA
ncbi:hypothetical protein RvY_13557 [Ramazzottius varieornatus]|uniref:Uncharacterized protein n=1 Tax=Ramazzottius varieornatus TaxID=947166 RepID=A0A1D1VNB6_RAMVA|nr:hypothetical protein RvY_13557 [Ramazzottius varieornatus]